jgi:hypothetical protein
MMVSENSNEKQQKAVSNIVNGNKAQYQYGYGKEFIKYNACFQIINYPPLA